MEVLLLSYIHLTIIERGKLEEYFFLNFSLEKLLIYLGDFMQLL